MGRTAAKDWRISSIIPWVFTLFLNVHNDFYSNIHLYKLNYKVNFQLKMNFKLNYKYFSKTKIFDKLRDDPKSRKIFSKLHCINGDITKRDLGLSRENLEMLVKNIDVVFHMAANVRFDQALKPALLLNTGGALNVLEFALGLKNLKAFIHVSTCYCHCDETVLEEKIYPAPHNPKWAPLELFISQLQFNWGKIYSFLKISILEKCWT